MRNGGNSNCCDISRLDPGMVAYSPKVLRTRHGDDGSGMAGLYAKGYGCSSEETLCSI